MAFSKHYRVGLVAALSLSMLTMLLAKQDFNASQTVTLNPKTIVELKAVTMALNQIGGDNKVLGAVVSPVQSLCQLCLGGTLPGLVGLLQAIVAALLARTSGYTGSCSWATAGSLCAQASVLHFAGDELPSAGAVECHCGPALLHHSAPALSTLFLVVLHQQDVLVLALKHNKAKGDQQLEVGGDVCL